MDEEQTRQTLKVLLEGVLVPEQPVIDRAVQIAKQIGSSWATKHINLICHDTTGNGRFRMVIE